MKDTCKVRDLRGVYGMQCVCDVAGVQGCGAPRGARSLPICRCLSIVDSPDNKAFRPLQK